MLDYNMDPLRREDTGCQTDFSCTFRMSSAILIAYSDTFTERDAAMNTQQFLIGRIPAVLYGEHAERLWLFFHGQMGHKEEAEAFAKIVCPKGAQVLSIDLPGHGARQERSEELNPWTVDRNCRR